MPELKELRGDIIERFANLETLMGAVLSQFFVGRVTKPFMFDLLGDEYCSFALKRRVLLKVAPDLADVPGFQEALNRLNTIRNYFAHVGTLYIDASGGGGERTPDPRDFDKTVDLQALNKEFLEREGRAVDVLAAKFKALGGELYAQPPPAADPAAARSGAADAPHGSLALTARRSPASSLPSGRSDGSRAIGTTMMAGGST